MVQPRLPMVPMRPPPVPQLFPTRPPSSPDVPAHRQPLPVYTADDFLPGPWWGVRVMEGLEWVDRGLSWVATPVSYIPFVALPANVYLQSRGEFSSVYQNRLSRGEHPGWAMLPAAGSAGVRGAITGAVGRLGQRLAGGAGGFGQNMLNRAGEQAGRLARGTTRHVERGLRAVANAVVGLPTHAAEAHLGNVAGDYVTNTYNRATAPGTRADSQFRVAADTQRVGTTLGLTPGAPTGAPSGVPSP